jgi:hypothetical protein
VGRCWRCCRRFHIEPGVCIKQHASRRWAIRSRPVPRQWHCGLCGQHGPEGRGYVLEKGKISDDSRLRHSDEGCDVLAGTNHLRYVVIYGQRLVANLQEYVLLYC